MPLPEEILHAKSAEMQPYKSKKTIQIKILYYIFQYHSIVSFGEASFLSLLKGILWAC